MTEAPSASEKQKLIKRIKRSLLAFFTSQKLERWREGRVTAENLRQKMNLRRLADKNLRLYLQSGDKSALSHYKNAIAKLNEEKIGGPVEFYRKGFLDWVKKSSGREYKSFNEFLKESITSPVKAEQKKVYDKFLSEIEESVFNIDEGIKMLDKLFEEINTSIGSANFNGVLKKLGDIDSINAQLMSTELVVHRL